MLNILTITSLYPNSEQIRHGVFVEERLRHLLVTGSFRVEVVAPVPWFPIRSARFGRYARFARVPAREERLGRIVSHPRYLTVPKVGMSVAPFLMAAGIAPLVRRIRDTMNGPVVLDGHFLYPDGVAVAILAKRLGLPYVLTARGADVTLYPRYRIPRFLILRACSGASRVVTVSDGLRDLLLKLGVNNRKVITLRNGVDLEKFSPVDRGAARAAAGFNRHTILAVGHLIPRKNHELIIRAMPRVPTADLVIIGEGPLKSMLIELARAVGVGDRVRFLPNMLQAELVKYYTAADISVLTSIHEGMPNVVLESLACGTPVVSTPVEGVRELMGCPAAGQLVPDRDPMLLANAINRVLAQPPDRADTREHAASFGWSPTILGLSAVLENAALDPTAD